MWHNAIALPVIYCDGSVSTQGLCPSSGNRVCSMFLAKEAPSMFVASFQSVSSVP